MYDDRSTTRVHTMSFKQYKKMKLKALKNDFCVTLTEEELKHADTLKTEAAVDQFCIGILNKRWG